MREVESCFQRLEQRYALFTSGPARADRFWETVSPAPADVVRTTLFKLDSKAKNRPAHRKADSTDRVADSAVRDGPPYQSVTDVLTAPCSPITSHLSPLTAHLSRRSRRLQCVANQLLYQIPDGFGTFSNHGVFFQGLLLGNSMLLPASAIGKIVMEHRQQAIERVSEFCFYSFSLLELFPEPSPCISLVRWQQSKYPFGRLFFFGRFFEITSSIVDKGIPGIDLHEIMDKRHPNHARSIDRLIRVFGKQQRGDCQVPAVLSRVLVTVGIQYITLPVHLFQPVNFKNKLDL